MVRQDEDGINLIDDVGVGTEKIKTIKVFYSDNRSFMTTIAPVTDTEAWIANTKPKEFSHIVLHSKQGY